jgi:hypothetical protein
MQTKFWSENLKGSDHSEDLGVDGRIKLEWILQKLCVEVEWVHLSLVRDQRQALGNMVMNLSVP